jgi:hypothetical protein
MKRLASGEHPAWMWLAFLLVVFIFVLHGSWSRTETFAIPSIGGGSLSANVA